MTSIVDYVEARIAGYTRAQRDAEAYEYFEYIAERVDTQKKIIGQE